MNHVLKQLHQAIEQAKAEELNTKAMEAIIRNNLETLHSAISIQSTSPDSALLVFVNDYVDIVPEHLQALEALATEANIIDAIEPFLKLIHTYFLNPPDILKRYSGLESALQKSYLAHRLMEEVNDQVMNIAGAALAPIDMSMANIICHAIIGDDLANQLDHLVLLTVETTPIDKRIFQQEKVKQFMEMRKFNGWQEVIERWPCFTKDCAIDLQLGI